MERLRAPEGCPWDREQTHASLCETLVEECCELLDTIDREDMPHMREELGDVLLQVVFHCQMAKEAGHFGFDDVARGINEKLVRRHPHVFGEESAGNPAEVLVHWERIKAEEKRERGEKPGLFKDLPPLLPSLLYARDVYKQLVKKDLLSASGIERERVRAEAENLVEDEAGRRLFELAAACREAGIDPESALRRYSNEICRDVEDQIETKTAL